MSTQIAQLYAKIGADVSGFEKGMKSSHTALASFSAALGTGLVAAAAIGVAAIGTVGAVIGKGVKAAASFEQSIADIASTMGKTSAEIEPLKKLIMDLGLDPKLKVSTNEAAAAIASLVKNGLTMDQVLQGAAKSTVLLANATGADFGTAADIATDVMQQFNISAADMDKAVNGILGVTQASKFSIDDYKLAIGQAGGVASSVGVEFDDFNAALVATAFNFTGGSDAGTSFKQFLATITPTTQPAIKAMEELGLITADGSNQFYDAAGNMKSMTEMATILKNATAGLSEEQKKQTFQTIFGNDASRTAYALAKVGGEEIAKVKEIIGNTDAEAAAATRMDTLSGQWEIFRGVLEATSIKIGDAFLPAAKKIVEWAQAAADKHLPAIIAWFEKFAAWLTEALPKIEAFIEKLAGWAAAFINWATGSGKALDTVSTDAESMWTKVSGAFGGVVEWVKTNLPQWMKTLGEWGAAAGDWITNVGWPKLKEKLPIWWNNLVDWVRTNYPIWVAHLQEWGNAAGDWITETGWPRLKAKLEIWGPALWDWLKTNLPIFMGHLVEWAVQLGAWVIQGIAFLIDNLANGVQSVSRWLRGTGQDGIKDGVGSWIGPMWEWVMTELWPKLEPALWALSAAILKMIGSMGGLIFDAIMAIARGVVNVFIKRTEEEWAMFSTWWTNTWTDFVGLVGDIWGIATEWASDIIAGFKQGITDAWTGFKAWWSDLWTDITDIPKLIFGTHSPSTVFAGIGSNVMVGYQTGVGKELPSTMMQAAAVSQQLADATKQSLTLVKMTDVGTTAMAGVEQGISQGAIEAEKTALWASLSLYTQFGDGIKTGDMMKLSVAATNAMQKGMELGSPELFKAAERISNEVKNQIQNGADTNKMAALGMDAMQGLADGVTENSWRAKNAAADAAHDMIQRTKEVLDSHSPSKVFYDIGAGVIQGMANGIGDTMPIIARVLSGMSKTVTTVVAGMYDQINAATAEIALRATHAGILVAQQANVHNDLMTQNNAIGAGTGTSGYNYLDEIDAAIARQQAVQDAARAARLAAEEQASLLRVAAANEAAMQTYASKASVFEGTNYQQYLNPYGAGASLSGYGEGKVSAAVNLLEQLKSAGGVEAVSKGYNITIENMNLGGSGNAVTDIIQAISFLNASYGYGY